VGREPSPGSYFEDQKLPAIKEGTQEWKVQLEGMAVRHLRALDQIVFAHRCLERLSQEGDTSDEIIKSALFTSAVIHYSRPFGKNLGEQASFSKYSIKDLQHHPEVDRVLHGHILVLRNKLVAHQDRTLLRARIGHFAITLHEDEVEIPVQTFAVVFALQGIATEETLARYRKHVAACVEAIHANVGTALTAVNAAEHEYPDVKLDGRQKVSVFSRKSIAKAEVAPLPDLDDTEVAMIKSPDFPGIPANAYTWRRTVIKATPEATYEWTGPEGVRSLRVGQPPPPRGQE
jgi:hypothetical protein